MVRTDFPTFAFEEEYWTKGYTIIGIDEVGRGCLAGPVTVAGVCLCTDTAHAKALWINQGINDSKKLSHLKRTQLDPIIKDQCVNYAICSTDVEIINNHGIVYALHAAIHTVIKDMTTQLGKKKYIAFVDGLPIPQLAIEQQAIVKGDGKSLSIAAASIIAKVHRDKLMNEYALFEQYKYYDWQTNKGYGTQKHRDAIKTHGPSNLHRSLFIRNTVRTV